MLFADEAAGGAQLWIAVSAVIGLVSTALGLLSFWLKSQVDRQKEERLAAEREKERAETAANVMHEQWKAVTMMAISEKDKFFAMYEAKCAEVVSRDVRIRQLEGGGK